MWLSLGFEPPSFLFFVTSKSIIVYCAKPQGSRFEESLNDAQDDGDVLGKWQEAPNYNIHNKKDGLSLSFVICQRHSQYPTIYFNFQKELVN